MIRKTWACTDLLMTFTRFILGSKGKGSWSYYTSNHGIMQINVVQLIRSFLSGGGSALLFSF